MLVIHSTTPSVSRKFMYIYVQGRLQRPRGVSLRQKKGSVTNVQPTPAPEATPAGWMPGLHTDECLNLPALGNLACGLPHFVYPFGRTGHYTVVEKTEELAVRRQASQHAGKDLPGHPV